MLVIWWFGGARPDAAAMTFSAALIMFERAANAVAHRVKREQTRLGHHVSLPHRIVPMNGPIWDQTTVKAPAMTDEEAEQIVQGERSVSDDI